MVLATTPWGRDQRVDRVPVAERKLGAAGATPIAEQGHRRGNVGFVAQLAHDLVAAFPTSQRRRLEPHPLVFWIGGARALEVVGHDRPLAEAPDVGRLSGDPFHGDDVPARVGDDDDVAHHRLPLAERRDRLLRGSRPPERPPQGVHHRLSFGSRLPGARAVHDDRNALCVHAADDSHEARPGHRGEGNGAVLEHEEHRLLFVVDVVRLEIERPRQQRVAPRRPRRRAA